MLSVKSNTMSRRIIEIGSAGFYLRCQNQQLIIQQGDDRKSSIPIEDISALILDHPQSTISQVCLSQLVQNNVAVIVSNEQHHPVGLQLNLEGNSLQAERFQAQVTLRLPRKKQLWKQIVKCKVEWQGKILHDLYQNDGGISALAKKVQSGDRGNIEAQAARRYWPRLFPEQGFKRLRDAPDQNRFLNYGYAILRALTARSLVAAGLHPTFGLHHQNRYNAYALADDLMEPYRPLVDLRVWELLQEYNADTELNQQIRQQLLQWIERRVTIDEEYLTMQHALQRSAQSLWQCIAGERKALLLPTL